MTALAAIGAWLAACLLDAPIAEEMWIAFAGASGIFEPPQRLAAAAATQAG